MTFHIETSTLPKAVGAGAPPKKFVDYTHKLKFENPETGDTATALATFGAGDELDQTRLWAERAHGLDLVAVEPFDAAAEEKRRTAAAEERAAELAAAQTEADRIIVQAHQDAAQIRRDAQSEADDMIAEAARIRRDAESEAAELLGGFGAKEEDALAELDLEGEGDQAGASDKVNDAGQGEGETEAGEGNKGGRGSKRPNR